jgi:hypothetical protein
MADILHRAQGPAHRQVAARECHVSRPVLLAIALGFACVGLALGFACIGLALPAQLTIVAIVPVLISIVVVLAAFRVMG